MLYQFHVVPVSLDSFDILNVKAGVNEVIIKDLCFDELGVVVNADNTFRNIDILGI